MLAISQNSCIYHFFDEIDLWKTYSFREFVQYFVVVHNLGQANNCRIHPLNLIHLDGGGDGEEYFLYYSKG